MSRWRPHATPGWVYVLLACATIALIGVSSPSPGAALVANVRLQKVELGYKVCLNACESALRWIACAAHNSRRSRCHS